MADDEFYNPYQFIPLGDQAAWAEHDHAIPKRGQFDKTGFAGSRLSHAAYDQEPGLLHGRILCKLTLRQPIFIGAERGRRGGDKDDYMLVEPYTIGGEPAIPASSLRGLISSLTEAASGSALRVLDDKKPVSFRKRPNDALSAVGMIERDAGSPTGLSVRPLAAPTLVVSSDERDLLTIQRWEKVFGGELPLKMLFGQHTPNADRIEDTHQWRAFSRRLTLKLDDNATFPGIHRKYYMKAEVKVSGEAVLSEQESYRFHYRVINGKRYVFGLAAPDPIEICGEKFEFGQDPQDAGFTLGHIRVSGAPHRQLPRDKKHEMFVPDPEEAAVHRKVPVPQRVIQAFELLADERGATQDKSQDVEPNARLPYAPIGQESLPDKGEKRPHRLRLKPGQLVFFDVEEDDDWFRVGKISFSSIWRGLVGKLPQNDEPDAHIASTWDFFEKDQNGNDRSEILPFNAKRKTISPAEAMFGFVSADATPDGRRGAYAGRVRFSAARLAQPVPESGRTALFCDDGTLKPTPEDPPGPSYVTLKILSSPKPPSPAMYFRPDGNGKPIPKHDLRVRHEPNGRKVYLHKDKLTDKPWVTAPEKQNENKNQKNAVRPLDPKACNDRGGFWFHIDFDNLTEAELDLLCFALRPTEAYRHKLGMGKPIGLGAVRIDPVALFSIERTKRYGDLFGERYTQVRTAETLRTIDGKDQPELRYGRELKAATAPSALSGDFDLRAKQHKERMPGEVFQAIRLTGDPDKLGHVPVHYPLARNQDPETKLFQWFANNNRSHAPQALAPVECNDDTLKPLKKN